MSAQARRRRKKSTRRQSKFVSFLIVLAVLFVCTISALKVKELRTQGKELAYAESVLEQKIEAAKQENDVLLARQQYMQTNKYIEDVAKDKLGLVYPDEIVIKPQQ
ncbi:MAG: cell division protein FtsL [Lachnospiraceae bacterium]|nr:cell division protein FtsL [Lachnospiraceae bacterium]